MTLFESFLNGYEPQPISSPVLWKGAPVGLLLDPGHGIRQYTSGKRSPDGRLIEGEWNRETAARLIPDLRLMGIDARCIVPEDQDIKLEDRAARANKIIRAEPDKKWFYLSIHLNAANKKDCDKNGWCKRASGVVVYASTNASDTSKAWAKTMVGAAHRFGLKGDRSMPKEGYWTAGWYVIRCTKMPAILTESLFMTNPDEVDFLLSERGKETIANMHFAGLCDFFGLPYAHVIG